ncbi:hypothetical protein ElyMa_006960000 [Elysia marginata]|uniref:Uncharacterized protein n=1 Tax=Elysia marginata TaxID=1093978 RepID=A0AAV4JP79_9GAST|nr:hypothetical protein ElyMa_006960000 [Elysia marginata]
MRKKVSGPGTLKAIQEAFPTASKSYKEMYDQTSAHPTKISKSILKKLSTKPLAGIGMSEDRKREFGQFGIDPDQFLKKIRRIERSLEDDSDDF